MHLVGLVTVAVLAYAPPGGHAADRLAEARQAIERALVAGGVEVIEEPIAAAKKAHAAGVTDEQKLAFFAQARAKVEEGRRALERVELPVARARFAEAERILEPELSRPGVATLLSDVMLLAGIAAYDDGDRVQAEAAFRRAVALEPAAELTEATVRPELVRAFRAATVPRPPSERLRTDGGADEKLGQAMDSLAARPDREALLALMDLLGIDGVIVAAAGVDAGALTLVAARVEADGCVTAPLTRTIDAAAALVGRLREVPCGKHEATEVLSAPAIAHPRPAPVGQGPIAERRKRPVIESPWLWSGVIAAAGLAIGLGVGLAPHTTSYAVSVDGGSFAR